MRELGPYVFPLRDYVGHLIRPIPHSPTVREWLGKVDLYESQRSGLLVKGWDVPFIQTVLNRDHSTPYSNPH